MPLPSLLHNNLMMMKKIRHTNQFKLLSPSKKYNISCLWFIQMEEKEREGGKRERGREGERGEYCLITDACVNIYFSVL